MNEMLFENTRFEFTAPAWANLDLGRLPAHFWPNLIGRCGIHLACQLQGWIQQFSMGEKSREWGSRGGVAIMFIALSLFLLWNQQQRQLIILRLIFALNTLSKAWPFIMGKICVSELIVRLLWIKASVEWVKLIKSKTEQYKIGIWHMGWPRS